MSYLSAKVLVELKIYKHFLDYTHNHLAVFHLSKLECLTIVNTEYFNVSCVCLTHNCFSIIMTLLGHDLFFKHSRVKSKCSFKVTMLL